MKPEPPAAYSANHVADPDADRSIRRRLHLGEFAATRLPALPLRPPMRLTPGELDVIAHLFRGKTEPQIARARGTSRRTVLNQVTSIFRKLGLRSREELLALLGAPAK